jgi:hypothetical protein
MASPEIREGLREQSLAILPREPDKQCGVANPVEEFQQSRRAA